MTIQELMRIVRILANSCFVRYWRHYNYPANPPLMAIAVIGADSFGELDKDLTGKGFKLEPLEKEFNVWTIPRTDLDWMQEGDR